ARGDGALETVDSAAHSEHEEGIVKMRELGIEKGEGLGGLGDAASNEQFGENDGQTGFAGECGGFFGVRFRDNPALTRGGPTLARQRGLRQGSPIYGAGRAHALYSSSSSCECASSITMSWKASRFSRS